MPNAELVKNIGVVNRNVGNHQIGNEQLLEHVGANVSLLKKLARRAAGQTRLLHGRTNQLSFDSVKVYAVLVAEGPHDKDVQHRFYLLLPQNAQTRGRHMIEMTEVYPPPAFFDKVEFR